MDQTSIFDLMYQKFKINKPIRLIELFSGYGSTKLAWNYLNVPVESWKTCEWAIKILEEELVGTYDYHQSNNYIGDRDRKHIGKQISDTLLASGHHNTLLIKNATKQGYLEAEDGDGVDISGRMEYHRGTVQKGMTQTLSTMGGENNEVVLNNLRIRKLTPRECFRLMGVKDQDFDKVKVNQSDSSLYHLAGDSIVVQCLEAIFKEILLVKNNM